MYNPHERTNCGSRRGLQFAALAVLILLALSLVVWWLWNALMPGVFGCKPIHFWQAMGLLVLSRLLFGGLPRGLSQRFHRRHHMLQRWERMNPEEREQFRRGIKRHAHHRSAGPDDPTRDGA